VLQTSFGLKFRALTNHCRYTIASIRSVVYILEANFYRMATDRHGRVVNTLLRVWELPGSNLGPETGYPDCFFRGFPQSLQANAVVVS
jgi:hypothetical protein